MPKIFEYFGFIFYFYSNEHEPIHVHVLHSGKESIFDLIMMNGELVEIRVREKKGAEPLPEKDNRTAEAFITKYHKNHYSEVGEVLCIEAEHTQHKD